VHTRWAVFGIFILSGAAGLIYEIVWARQLVLVFGNTTQAVSAILTGFFGGMAIGSVVGGRFADRVRAPLRLYGIIELALVGIVLATPLTFGLVHEVYRGSYAALEGSPQALALVRLVLALVAMGPATILMGVTLPALTRHLTQDAHLSQAFGRLYAANTYGAILGTLAAGLVLIELFGLTGALVVGAACSGIAGVIAILLPVDAGRRTVAAGVRAVGRVAAEYPSRPRLALVVAFISGITALGYQVLWVRLLSSGTGNTTYVFTIILAIFLLGIALGAMVFNILRPRLRDPLRLLAVTQIAVAALAIAGLVLVLVSPRDMDPGRPLQTVVALVVSVLLVVLPVTIALGIAFPTSSALLSEDEQRAGRHSGQLLAVNTVGAICGSLLIPFFLVPALGSPNVVAVLAMVNGALGAVLAWIAWRGTTTGRVTAAAGVAVVAVAVVAMSLPGVLVQPNEASIRERGGTVFESQEDEIASVQAGQVRSTPELWVAGTSMTLLTIDAKLMPLMPLIARPDAESALIVAFGMGSSYRSALIAGLETEAVELVPSVVDMFGWYYDDAEKFANHPSGRIVVADGRNHLELSGRRYDIIVTDPPPPIFSSGASVISSLEYFEAGRDHLTPAGVMMQWTPHGTTADEFREHIRTFATVFPEVLIARGPGGYGNFMLGSMEPMELTRDAIEGVLARPGVLEDLVSAYDSPADTLQDWAALIDDLTWLNGDDVGPYAGDGPLVTDDRPLPEYFLLRRLAAGDLD
jgi:predicted membrane-bound spermidine synthase